jgi:hypothetical protein
MIGIVPVPPDHVNPATQPRPGLADASLGPCWRPGRGHQPLATAPKLANPARRVFLYQVTHLSIKGRWAGAGGRCCVHFGVGDLRLSVELPYISPATATAATILPTRHTTDRGPTTERRRRRRGGPQARQGGARGCAMREACLGRDRASRAHRFTQLKERRKRKRRSTPMSPLIGQSAQHPPRLRRRGAGGKAQAGRRSARRCDCAKAGCAVSWCIRHAPTSFVR